MLRESRGWIFPIHRSWVYWKAARKRAQGDLIDPSLFQSLLVLILKIHARDGVWVRRGDRLIYVRERARNNLRQEETAAHSGARDGHAVYIAHPKLRGYGPSLFPHARPHRR